MRRCICGCEVKIFMKNGDTLYTHDVMACIDLWKRDAEGCEL